MVRQIIEAKSPDPLVREKMWTNWKMIEEIDQKYPEALSITRVSELGYIHPAADHQEIERKLQTKAVLRDRKNARLRDSIRNNAANCRLSNSPRHQDVSYDFMGRKFHCCRHIMRPIVGTTSRLGPATGADGGSDRHRACQDFARSARCGGDRTGPRGRLWAAWYAGKSPRGVESSSSYVVLATSDDDGATWREKLVLHAPRLCHTYDPCLWLDPNKRLWFFWRKAPGCKMAAWACGPP